MVRPMQVAHRTSINSIVMCFVRFQSCWNGLHRAVDSEHHTLVAVVELCWLSLDRGCMSWSDIVVGMAVGTVVLHRLAAVVEGINWLLVVASGMALHLEKERIYYDRMSTVIFFACPAMNV